MTTATIQQAPPTTMTMTMTPEARREAVALLHAAGLSTRKIGVQLGISEATARRDLRASTAGTHEVLPPDTSSTGNTASSSIPASTQTQPQPQPQAENAQYSTAQATLQQAQRQLATLTTEQSGIETRMREAMEAGDGTAFSRLKARSRELPDLISAATITVADADLDNMDALLHQCREEEQTLTRRAEQAQTDAAQAYEAAGAADHEFRIATFDLNTVQMRTHNLEAEKQRARARLDSLIKQAVAS